MVDTDYKVPTAYEVTFDPEKSSLSFVMPKAVFDAIVYTHAELIAILDCGIVVEDEEHGDSLVFKRNLPEKDSNRDFLEEARDIVNAIIAKVEAILVDNDLEAASRPLSGASWRIEIDIPNTTTIGARSAALCRLRESFNRNIGAAIAECTS